MIFKPLGELPLTYVFVIVILCSGAKIGFTQPQQTQSDKRSLDLSIADSLLFNQFYNKAAFYYLKDLVKSERDKNWESVAYALNKIGFCKIADFNLSEGNQYLNQSKEIINSKDLLNTHVYADYLTYMGIYFARMEKYDSAFLYHDKAIRIKKEIAGPNSETLAESLYFYGQCLSDYGRLTDGENMCRKSVDMYHGIYKEDNNLTAKVYSTLSSILRRKFDYQNAVIYGEMAIQIFENSQPFLVNSVIIAQIILGNIHTYFNKFNEAKKIYSQAIYYLDNDPNANIEYKIKYLYPSLGSLYNQLEDPQKAIFYIQESINYLEEKGEYSSEWRAWLTLVLGESNSLQGNFEEAKKNSLFASKTLVSMYGENIDEVIICYETMGRIYRRAVMFDSSLYYFQKSLNSLLPGFNNMDININPTQVGKADFIKLYDILYGKADVLRRIYFDTDNVKYLKEALKIYFLVDKINDEARNSPMAESSIMVLNEYYSSEYEKGIDCAYLLYELTRDNQYLGNAFSLMEKSKYMLLFKSLATAQSFNQFNLPANLKDQEDSLKSQYINYQILIDQEHTKEVINQEYLKKLENKRSEYAIALDNFKLYIQGEYPNYAQIKYDSLSKTYEDFKANCIENECLGIEYYWGNKSIYVITTTEGGSPIFKIERDQNLDTSLYNMLLLLAGHFSLSNSQEDYRNYVESAYSLFEYIIQDPLKEYTGQNLLIIPDGMLAQLPFEALLTESVRENFVDYQRLPYLINEYNFKYVYSVNLLLGAKAQTKKIKNRLLALSYSSIDALTDKNDRSGDQDELQHSALELRGIKKEMGRRKCRYYYDIQATEYLFKENASHYNLIHLAVHGETDTASAMNSKLIFKDSLDTKEDGRLYMHELYGLDLSNTELAVLSACETGIGKNFKGEGVFSMARGFAYAGCPSIVMSLWRVNDQYTAELMSGFYKYLNKGNSISRSICLSKREFLRSSDEFRAHPSNWAAFVAVGKDSIIAKRSYAFYYLLTVVFVVLAIFMYVKYKK